MCIRPCYCPSTCMREKISGAAIQTRRESRAISITRPRVRVPPPPPPTPHLHLHPTCPFSFSRYGVSYEFTRSGAVNVCRPSLLVDMSRRVNPSRVRLHIECANYFSRNISVRVYFCPTRAVGYDVSTTYRGQDRARRSVWIR